MWKSRPLATRPSRLAGNTGEESEAMAVNGILGIKLGMTQFFAADGTSVPCTVLQAGPCVVVQRRTKDKDGGDATHGSMFHRAPGGIGGSSFPSRVWPGQHFPGHMGNQRVTSKNLAVVKIDTEENLLLVRGAVPGPQGAYLLIHKAKRSK